MSLQTRLVALAQAIGGDIKTLYAQQGNLAALSTTAKASLVAAINELYAALAAASEIDDTAASATTTYSSTKVLQLLAALRGDILGGASAAYDTLQELQALLESDATAISGLLNAVSNRIRFDAPQTLTAEQQRTASENIGVGDPEHDFVAEYEEARDA